MKDNKELIDDYLDGNLSGQALKTFQEQIKNDDEFAEKVEIVLGLRKATMVNKKEIASEKELRKTLKSLGDKYFVGEGGGVPRASKERVHSKRKEATKPGASMLPKWAVATASVALLVVGSLFYFSNTSISFDDFIAEEKVKSCKLTTRGIDAEKSPTLLPGDTDEGLKINLLIEKEAQQADKLFDNENYAEAKVIYNKLLKYKNNTITKSIYTGNSINFEAIMWNNVLIEVGLKNKDEAKKQIGVLLESDISEKYKKKAQRLKEMMQE